MSSEGIALTIGPLDLGGRLIRRSGIRWLRGNGQFCRPGDVVAYCNIGLDARESRLAEDMRGMQLAFATPVAGRLHHQAQTQGGFHDYQPIFLWKETDVLARVEPASGASGAGTAAQVRLYMMAGRRVSELGADSYGLLTGWHDRKRVSHADGGARVSTLLSLASCEIEGVVRGTQGAFLELLRGIGGPAQIVLVPNHPLVPTARVIAEQVGRDDGGRRALAEDLAATLAGSKVLPTAADWMFAGALLRALQTSPATERYSVLTRNGFQSAGPPEAIILSVNAEKRSVLRHRRLGYTLSVHNFRLKDAGRAFVPWLKTNFESVRVTVDDVLADYRTLIDLIRESAPDTVILIANAMSSNGYEDIPTYAPFSVPLGENLASMRAKDVDLMLSDLARERDVAIIDADAIAAEFGARRSIPDGMHQNGEMQAELRAEILRILRARRVPGFAREKLN